MTADQMPELDKCPFCGSDARERSTWMCCTNPKCHLFNSACRDSDEWNTRATPPKSQWAVWENVVELCHALTLARGIISVWCKDAPKENLSDWDIKWEAANKAVVAIQEATRQHPTPAQAQGESVTVEELAADIYDHATRSFDPVASARECAEILSEKYTIIKRTE